MKKTKKLIFITAFNKKSYIKSIKMQRLSSGLTLAELLIAASILALGLGVAMFGLAKSLQGVESQHLATQAIDLAQSRLERIRAGLHHSNDNINIGFSDITETAANGGYAGTYFSYADTSGNEYHGQTRVVTLSGSDPTIYNIDVWVCVRLKNGKIIGSDTNWDNTADESGGYFESPFHLETAIVDME